MRLQHTGFLRIWGESEIASASDCCLPSSSPGNQVPLSTKMHPAGWSYSRAPYSSSKYEYNLPFQLHLLQELECLDPQGFLPQRDSCQGLSLSTEHIFTLGIWYLFPNVVVCLLMKTQHVCPQGAKLQPPTSLELWRSASSRGTQACLLVFLRKGRSHCLKHSKVSGSKRKEGRHGRDKPHVPWCSVLS